MIPAVETKSVSDDIASAFDDFARAFEAFKDTNDTRLSEIETRLSSDVVTEEKLTRIDVALDDAKRRLDRLALDRSRPPLGRGVDAPRDPVQAEHKTAFQAYMRSGEATGLKRLEEKGCPPGQGRMAATSCLTRSRPRSCAACPRSRRSAPSHRCA